MIFKKKTMPLLLGLASTALSIGVLASTGHGIADGWRSAVDGALGTSSYVIDSTGAKYVSKFNTATELMNELKEISVQEGREGTVIMKNANAALPLAAGAKVNLWGGASYTLYRGMSQAGNTDQIDLVKALTDAGFQLDPTLKGIYEKLSTKYVEVPQAWGPAKKDYTYGPNTTAPAYDVFQIKEANPTRDFASAEGGEAAANWNDSLTGDINIITFSRPGGEGNTYKPGSSKDTLGNVIDQNPFALSPDELSVVDAAKATGKKTIVLINTSCQIEVEPLVNGTHAVDGIVFIGMPNDYQCKGIVEVLAGKVNATGALADTYAVSSLSSPSMMNFGGDTFSDYEKHATKVGEDPRWNRDIKNFVMASSFSSGEDVTYNGSGYYVEAEGIYTGYNYYETRYYDAMRNKGNAKATKGSIDGQAWDYDKEVSYTFGYGLSYLDYEERVKSVTVDKSVTGNVTATITIKNKSDKEGMFRSSLYVSVPYTQYDITNKVEKSAIQFLNSAKVTLKAGESKDVEISIPTKYLASFDYVGAKTYILDGGKYYFTTGNGAHEAVKNVLTKEGVDGIGGNANAVYVWDNGSENDTDTTTFSKSATGVEVKSQLQKADMNYYLPGTVTYLSRNDWDGTYPVNYNTINGGQGVEVGKSAKAEEWIKEIRNQQYMVQNNDPVENFEGTGDKLSWQDIPASAVENINDPFWNEYVEQIPADIALGAIAHGGSQSDELKNIKNPVVKQHDGPAGFNSKPMSDNNGEKGKDPYYVDPDTEEGKFKGNVHSQTLAGSSFNPELAHRWGVALGNFGLWTSSFNIWAAGLNVHRNPYNGRNIEYLSEDEMLTNVWGREFLRGTLEYGILVGPKHLGFNDQEYNRAGVACFLNEQKGRETDLRGFQGAIEDAKALGYMCAFNRLGSTNVSHYVELHKNLIRGEWGFQGLITTDMMDNSRYFNPESCAMATITQMADFAPNNSVLNGGDGGVDAVWPYLSPAAIKNDNALVKASRQAMKYQLFAFANTAILNIKTTRVMPSWEVALISTSVAGYVIAGGLTILACLTHVRTKED